MAYVSHIAYLSNVSFGNTLFVLDCIKEIQNAFNVIRHTIFYRICKQITRYKFPTHVTIKRIYKDQTHFNSVVRHIVQF